MKRSKSKPWLLNKTESAAFFQISVQALSNWDVDPVEKRGNQVFFDLRDLVSYKHTYVANEGEEDKQLDLAQERAKLTIEQTRKAKLERKQLEGSLLDVEAVTVAIQQMTSAVRAKLLSIPTKLAQDLVNIETPLEVQEIIKIQIYELLNELSSAQFSEQIGVSIERMFRRIEAIQSAD